MPFLSGGIGVVQLALKQQSHRQLCYPGHQEQLEQEVLKQESADRKTQRHGQVEGPILPLVCLLPVFDGCAVHQHGVICRRIKIEGNTADKVTENQPPICRK
ncbi:hypothetical protein SDC9_134558 [bioreactor metagenome]|uniref:Uncharacterized protein n=1 Tax=bioreactor metagenome TaxID=1076179 RepID=A0A645DFW1_9ZZZZ